MSIPLKRLDDVERALEAVRSHLVRDYSIAYPTETVYGLGCRPTQQAIANLAALKGRPPNKPFLLLVSSPTMARQYGLVFNAAAEAMAREFWPGPLTLVLPGGEGQLPDSLRGQEGGVAVRWTGNESTARLIELLEHPITSTSANRPGGPTAPGVGAIGSYFGEEVSTGRLLILDGGVLGNVPPSTLVDCMEREPRLIREGAIPRDELHRKLGSYAP
ncbi:MAG: L-threonylcarbamoyladenylate synthase [Gemmatimonadales bacterium]